MKKLFLTLFISIFFAGLGHSQVTRLWEKSAAAGTKPAWESGSLTRGIAYGFVDGKHLMFVVNRTGGMNIVYYDAATGDSLGKLSTTGISGGVAIVNDIEVSTDGKIFLGNMTTNASVDNFKVYKYETLTSDPVVVLTDATTDRIGDKFTVTGSTADNSVTIWAASGLASAAPGSVYKFTTTDNGASFTKAVIPIEAASSTAVGPLPGGDFYVNAHGTRPTHYNADGSGAVSVPASVISTSGSAIRYITTSNGDVYLAANELLNPSTNWGKIIRVPGGDAAAAVVVDTTTTLGSTSPGGLGDIAVQKVSEYIFNIYVLATNNGFGAYQLDLTPTLSGKYYIGAPGTGPNGTDPDYLDLRAAFEAINSSKFSGDCTFYITSNLTEIYPTESYGLGLAVNPEPYTITFKPYTGVQPVITLPYPQDATSGPSGALVIGLPSEGNVAWARMAVTKNIVIDGSNTEGGTTRDLTITNETTSHRNGFPMTIVGDVSNLVIKNTNIYYKSQETTTSGNLFAGAVMVRSRVQNGAYWVPRNLTFENNHISSNFDGVPQSAQGYGVYDVTAAVPDFASGITLKNNKIEGKRRAVALYKAGSHDIIGNEIIINQNIAAGISSEGVYGVLVDTGSVINIQNNRFAQTSTLGSAAASAVTAISIESFGTYNIYNNMFSGFSAGDSPAAGATVRGIKNSSANANLNLYYNTIAMNALPEGVVYQGINISNGKNNVRNNIVDNKSATSTAYGFYRSGVDGGIISNNNNFTGNVGFWNNAAATTLAAWQTASGMDANSVSHEVTFVSERDLHLATASVGDLNLIGAPLSEVTMDIDGQQRHQSFPYMGADEGDIALPVELVSFSAKAADGKVMLTWKTATEINNKGFEVERKTNGEFKAIGFVEGRGNSTQEISYSFTDKDAAAGKYSYRLKQVNLDGSFAYSAVVEADVQAPKVFELSQNYPNPFNPTTTISFQIANPVNVSLVVYDMLGAEVAVLINNEFTDAGVHNFQFNAANLATGTYIYRLTAGDFVQTKKMVLMK